MQLGELASRQSTNFEQFVTNVAENFRVAQNNQTQTLGDLTRALVQHSDGLTATLAPLIQAMLWTHVLLIPNVVYASMIVICNDARKTRPNRNP